MDNRDPRSARTRESLRAAVFELASRKSIEKVSVAELCRAAGISRDTFYRYAADANDLLVGLLTDELAAVFAAAADLPATSGSSRSVFEAPERELLDHVARHRDLYRLAFADGGGARLRRLLTTLVEAALTGHLILHPEIAPAVDGVPATDAQRAMFVAYAAAGTIGAIEAWLAHDDLDDVDAAVHAVLAASPEWWLGRS